MNDLYHYYDYHHSCSNYIEWFLIGKNDIKKIYITHQKYITTFNRTFSKQIYTIPVNRYKLYNIIIGTKPPFSIFNWMNNRILFACSFRVEGPYFWLLLSYHFFFCFVTCRFAQRISLTQYLSIQNVLNKVLMTHDPLTEWYLFTLCKFI